MENASQKPAIRAILFDKDGTIVDYEATWGPINRKAARIAAAGDPLLEARILSACGIDPVSGATLGDSLFAASGTREIAAAMIGQGSAFALADLTSRLDELFTSAAGAVVALADVADLFATLRSAGFHLGVATSDNEASARVSLAALGVGDHLSFVCGYDSGHGIKPQPGMVHAFCAAVGCTPGEVAIVGDNRHDLVMGRNAGCGAVIGVLSGTGSADQLAALADVCLTDIAALPHHLGLRSARQDT
ncbi:MAG: HAD family hydrolase [Rhodobiaceae bacterium]|nr:HAD family hydrolase [Rhodobiaceae bacterium]MCC0014705.1 HAD family hydrolase [Rhodobiaceae bacterium]MCC0041438.1 HAD family hydrolase [Rhodobiaceae bacterium]MCC0053792.1 HAD family hydrolase [Rhodobiaceae bacterium]